jgi:phosphopantothenoylcysteine decarboxylase/phosphopantothenate--cysteine ligase
LKSKRILLGITGGIAAYKAAELVRLLRKADIDVRVVMTQAATHFISPLTLQTLSQHSVYTELLDSHFEQQMGHIQLSRSAHLILVAPASAHFIARLAHGLADDLLTTLCLASKIPIALAPAMNVEMWQAAATQENIQTLRNRNIFIIDPQNGEQACGEIGLGRLAEPQDLLQWIQGFFVEPVLQNKTIVITAGPTQEPLDPVRYFSNRSSGKMGYAMAQAAQQLGARVRLISGPTALPCPIGVTRIQVTTAQDMLQAVLQQLPCDIFISVAAITDYATESPAEQKIKRDAHSLTLQLTKTPDILYTVAHQNNPPFTVGFAAETENVITHAKKKLQEKNISMIAANRVGPEIGFDSDKNSLTVLTETGQQILLPHMPKQQLAQQLMEIIAEQFLRSESIQCTEHFLSK